MNEIFIDCGTNLGQGYESLREQLNLDESVKVYMFEPNINCYNILCEKYKDNDSIKIYNKAVWDKEEERILNIEFAPDVDDKVDKKEIISIIKNIDSSVDVDGEKITGLIGGASNILQEGFIKPSHISDSHMTEWPPAHKQKVTCICLSEFIKNNFNKEDKIHLKLDIEGSEFKVLNKLVHDNTIAYINTLVVEWHDEMLKDYSHLLEDEEFIKNANKVNFNWSTSSDQKETLGQLYRKVAWLSGQLHGNWDLVPGMDPDTGFDEKRFVESMYTYKIKYIPWS